MTVALGLDPGLAALGWGVVARQGSTVVHVADGTLHTKPEDGDDERRAAQLGREVRAIIEIHRPQIVSVERWVHYPDAAPHQAHALGLVIGAVLSAVPESCALVLLRAVDLRASLGLPKGASKDAVRARVVAICGARGRSQHSADALGVAIVGASRIRTTKGSP